MGGGGEDVACKASIPNFSEGQKDHVCKQFIILKLLPSKAIVFYLKEVGGYHCKAVTFLLYLQLVDSLVINLNILLRSFNYKVLTMFGVSS